MNLPTIKWVCNADDDFVGHCKGWMLRVEQMDTDYWWWCVYYPDELKKYRIEDFDEKHARTMNEAIDYAVSSFYFHYTESKLF